MSILIILDESVFGIQRTIVGIFVIITNITML
jgi:hypothetical protein